MLETLALLAAGMATLVAYLASPNQALLPEARWPRGVLAGAATLLAALASWLWMRALGPVAGAFAALTALMLGCVVLPYWAATRRRR